jgi:hypothetical protein
VAKISIISGSSNPRSWNAVDQRLGSRVLELGVFQTSTKFSPNRNPGQNFRPIGIFDGYMYLLPNFLSWQWPFKLPKTGEDFVLFEQANSYGQPDLSCWKNLSRF